jgi:hypothetical protein
MPGKIKRVLFRALLVHHAAIIFCHFLPSACFAPFMGSRPVVSAL